MKHIFTILFLSIAIISSAQSLENTEWDFYADDEFEARFRFSTDTVFVSSFAFPEIPLSTYTESADTFRIIDLEESELGCADSYGQVVGTYLFTIENDTLLFSVVTDECAIRVESLDLGVFVRTEPLSVEEDKNAFGKIVLFPNPLQNGILNIESVESIDRIDIYDIMGKLLVTTSNVDQIDLTPFVQKLYFVRLTKGQKSITRKIVSK